MGSVTKIMENNKTAIRRGRTEIHRDQAIVERFNRTLAKRLFGYQYAVEMNMKQSGQRSTKWVKRIPSVVSALNNDVTRLTGKKPGEAIKEKCVFSKPATPYSKAVGLNEKKLLPQVNLRYLYQPVPVYNIEKVENQKSQLCTICLIGPSGASFVRN